MTAPTHIALSGAVYLYLCTMLRISLSFMDAGLMAFASLLPDIDISTSGIGWRIRPVSSWIEKKFGHRTITHSFLGIFGFGVLASPILLISITTYVMTVMGYFSHILIDLANKEGCQVYWPYHKWGVFPVNEVYRIQVGSRVETILLGGLIILAMLLYPVASAGLDRTLHWVMADINSAVKDYHVFSTNSEVFAELEGAYRKTDTKIAGAYRAVGALGENAVLIEIKDKLHYVGTNPESHIVPQAIRSIRGKPIEHHTQLLIMDGHTLGELAPLKSVEHRLFGKLRILATLDLRTNVLHIDPIISSGSTLSFDYATYKDIEALGLTDIPILTGNLVVNSTLPPDQAFILFSFIQPGAVVFPVEVSIAAHEDVLVKPGEQLNPGDILVAHSGKLRDITVVEAEIETKRKIRQDQSWRYAVHDQERERDIDRVAVEIARLDAQRTVYQKSSGFEEEIHQLQVRIEQLHNQKQSFLAARKEARIQNNTARLRYEQEMTELLAKKEQLEAAAFTKTGFVCEVVNVEFQQGKCVLYLRRRGGLHHE